MMDILIFVSYLIVVLICISLIISNVEYLLCAFWPSVCLLWKNVYSDLPLIFWLGLCFWYLAAWCVCIFWRLIPCRLLHLQIFSPNLRVLFSSIYEVDHKRFCINLCQSILCRFSSKNFIVSDLTFSSVTHFEFTFCIWY